MHTNPPWVIDSMKEDEREPNVILSFYDNSLNKCQIPCQRFQPSWFDWESPDLMSCIPLSWFLSDSPDLCTNQCHASGMDLIVFVGPGVGHLTDLVLPGEGIFESFFAQRGDIWLPTWTKKTETEHMFPPSTLDTCAVRSGKIWKSWKPTGTSESWVDFTVLSPNFLCFSVFLINWTS